MPGVYYVLSFQLRWFDVAHRAGDAIRFLIAARTLMWAIAAGVVALTVVLGARVGGRIVGWLSGALLSACVVFAARSMEIRPDVPGLLFWVASQVALVTALSPARTPPARRAWFAIGGLCLGGTLFFTQKALLAGPGFALFVVSYLVARVEESTVQSRIADLAVFAIGTVLPLAIIVGHFASNHAVADLVRGVLLNNLGWPQEVTAQATVRWMLLRDPILSALATAGAIQALIIMTRDPRNPFHAALLWPTASLVAGLWLIPTPYPQYLMLTFPLACVLAADYLWTVERALAPASPSRDGTTAWVFAIFCIVAVAALATARPFYRAAFVYPAVGLAAVAAAIVAGRRNMPTVGAVIVVLAVSSFSAQQLLWMRGLSNDDAVRQMDYIHQVTTTTDRVLDGFTGYGWFRPQAAFHWFVAPGARASLTDRELAAYGEMLRSCGDQPRLVILDPYVRQLAPDVMPAISQHYRPTSFPLLWLRAPDRPCDERGALGR